MNIDNYFVSNWNKVNMTNLLHKYIVYTLKFTNWYYYFVFSAGQPNNSFHLFFIVT